ncbi:MAG: class I SAM-dependent methyltransferase [Alphaproteobacteria bacterium]
MNEIKETSDLYGTSYQEQQAEKYRNRENNHWKARLDIADELYNKYVKPSFESKSNKDVVFVDIGCSIGTFAIEFAKKGLKTYGIDFDNSALEIARNLAKEENVSPTFVCGDVSNWSENFPEIDIAACFDIFEHLHDDELGSFLIAIKKNLSSRGCIIFNTFPAQYDYMFFDDSLFSKFFKVFKNLKPTKFSKLVRIMQALYDVYLLFSQGVTYQEKIKKAKHCNPTTKERLTDIFERSGYEIVFIDNSNLYNTEIEKQNIFKKQPITYRNIYGVVKPKNP